MPYHVKVHVAVGIFVRHCQGPCCSCPVAKIILHRQCLHLESGNQVESPLGMDMHELLDIKFHDNCLVDKQLPRKAAGEEGRA